MTWTGAADDNALFETPAGAIPQAWLRIRKVGAGNFAFSLNVSRAAISAVDTCVGAPRRGATPAVLQTRFRLETAGLDIAAEEPWDCGNGQIYRLAH